MVLEVLKAECKGAEVQVWRCGPGPWDLSSHLGRTEVPLPGTGDQGIRGKEELEIHEKRTAEFEQMPGQKEVKICY